MPLLAIPFPAIDPVAIEIGPVAVRWYGLAYMMGLLLGWLYVRRLLGEARLWPDGKAPMKPEATADLLLWTTIGVVVGGRLGHVLFYHPAEYLANPLEILAVWKGGMAFHGGLLGVVLALWLFGKHYKVSLLTVGDLVSAAVPFGLFFGRVANFINVEVVGTVTSMPWGVVFPGFGPEPHHPAQLYEAGLEGIVLFFILRYFSHTRLALQRPGTVTGVFLIGYGLFRIFVEMFKFVDYNMFAEGLPVTRGMVYSVPMVLLGIYLVHRARARAAAVA